MVSDVLRSLWSEPRRRRRPGGAQRHRQAPATSAATGNAAPPAQPVDALTDREEEEVLAEVARGRTNTEIAEDLCISLSTVKTHIASLMTRLSARNRVEIAMWAHETGRLR